MSAGEFKLPTGIFEQEWSLAKGGRSVNVGTPGLGCKIRCEKTRDDIVDEVMGAIARLPELLRKERIFDVWPIDERLKDLCCTVVTTVAIRHAGYERASAHGQLLCADIADEVDRAIDAARADEGKR